MYLSRDWKDYEIIAASNGEKLERWGEIFLLRPEPQAVWEYPYSFDDKKLHAHYIRSNTGGGRWEYKKNVPESWTIGYKDLRFIVRPTGFKHTGLFPEQAVNWDFMRQICENARRPLKVLNLFAYTGGATVALAASGAQVVHVDAAKGMVAWAKENLAASGLADKPVRFIVDDCLKFVLREIRRGNKYDGILMDPPSYGRGPNGEVWKIEDNLFPLVSECVKLLSDDCMFFLINSYTTGLAPSVLTSVLKCAIKRKGIIESEEIGLPITQGNLILPCGATGRWMKKSV
ncbi:MAG TPA: SAM-dependent methyltransferase [Clostridiales bacterium]|jgi:23S rRNA (cytosine1962-C5)-methyltransferase|nr:SAM-dependent methyltransferase [Clostridiales bacterium]